MRLEPRANFVVVNTRRLFGTLLRTLRIGAVCDVGSLDGAEALTFRALLPEAAIYALEPNPDNLRRMRADAVLLERRVEVMGIAATNFDGEADLFLVDAHASEHTRRGMSSLYARPDAGAGARAAVRVRTARLDTLLGRECAAPLRVALWIDTEGKAYEVIEGAAGLARQLYLLHVEVESAPCIDAAQKLYPDVRTLLEGMGFEEIATDQVRTSTQFNAVFVRGTQPMLVRMSVAIALVRARARWLLVGAARALCPACVRRYHAWRVSTLR